MVDPGTEEVIARWPTPARADARAAAAAAADAQPGWAATAPRQRAEVLRRSWELLTERADDLARLITLENGKVLAEAKGEITYAAEFFRWFSEEAVRLSGELTTAPSGANRILVVHQPVGVAFLVTPWNFPAAMATRKIAPALAAGCAVVLKPATLTPLTALAVADVLAEAGVPPGVVNVVPGRSASTITAAVLEHPRVRKLSFTGSTEVGKKLIEQAADRVLNVSMELGGNAPFIVLADADLDAAIEGAMIAKMRHNGETCTAANRFYVEAPVAEAFAAKLADAMGALPTGHGLEDGNRLGPLVDADTRDKVAELVDSAVGAGRQGRGRRRDARRHRLLLPGHRAHRGRGRQPDPRGGDLRAGRADRVGGRRRRGGAAGQRHHDGPRRLRVHRRPRQGPAHRRAARVRHGRPQQGHRVRPGRALRRREGVGHRPRGRPRGDARLHRDEVHRHRLVGRRA